MATPLDIITGQLLAQATNPFGALTGQVASPTRGGRQAAANEPQAQQAPAPAAVPDVFDRPPLPPFFQPADQAAPSQPASTPAPQPGGNPSPGVLNQALLLSTLLQNASQSFGGLNSLFSGLGVNAPVGSPIAPAFSGGLPFAGSPLAPFNPGQITFQQGLSQAFGGLDPLIQALAPIQSLFTGGTPLVSFAGQPGGGPGAAINPAPFQAALAALAQFISGLQ